MSSRVRFGHFGWSINFYGNFWFVGKARIKHRTSHEPDPIKTIRLV